jgi:hypothetical protein
LGLTYPNLVTVEDKCAAARSLKGEKGRARDADEKVEGKVRDTTF